jgi:hypothetical protein
MARAPERPALTAAEYAAGNGQDTQEMCCNGCGAHWLDHYKLVGYIALRR